MAVTCARGLLDVLLRQHTALCFRSPIQLRQFVTTSSQWNAPVTPPKRPPGAFVIFFQSKKDDIARNNPGMSMRDSIKIAAQMWHQLDPQEKNDKLLEARERFIEYRRQYELYRKDLTPRERDEIEERRKLRRQNLAKRRRKMELKKLGKPKRARNAFTLFVKSSKLERGDAPVTTYVKGLVEYWKLMPQEEKDIYLEDARLDRERYESEMKVWERKMKEIGREDVIRNKSRTRVKKPKAAKSPAKKVAKKKTTKSKTRKPKRKTAKTKPKSKSVSTQTD